MKKNELKQVIMEAINEVALERKQANQPKVTKSELKEIISECIEEVLREDLQPTGGDRPRYYTDDSYIRNRERDNNLKENDPNYPRGMSARDATGESDHDEATDPDAKQKDGTVMVNYLGKDHEYDYTAFYNDRDWDEHGYQEGDVTVDKIKPLHGSPDPYTSPIELMNLIDNAVIKDVLDDENISEKQSVPSVDKPSAKLPIIKRSTLP